MNEEVVACFKALYQHLSGAE